MLAYNRSYFSKAYFLPVVDCMDDLAELDLAELSAIIELEDDMAPSSVDS